ncbi:MAG: glycine cleavage system protein GcvH [Microbacteriaceae bacterium]|nr:MAG: glycine cleavage system protein GcvH [Microbacteriaceae bacterium]
MAAPATGNAAVNPEDLMYTAEHEWLRIEGGIATVGITEYAAEKLGDVVFVELPDVGSAAAEGKVVGEIESTKSVGELFAPANGTVTEANDAVVASPELVNTDPFGEGWLIKLELTGDTPQFLSAAEYTALVGE